MNNQSDTSDRASDAGSTPYSKKLELLRRSKLLTIRHEYEEQKENLEHELELENMGPGTKKSQDAIVKLNVELQQLEKRYERKQRQVQEEIQLEHEKENEDAQSSSSTQYEDSESQPGESQQEKEVQDKLNEDLLNLGHLNSPEVSRANKESVPSEGHLDKDMMLMQLMAQQMKILEKGQSSYADKKLPDFGGDPSDWGNFKAAYDRTNQKYNFEDSENLARLQAALKGKAKEAVKHLMANPLNVTRIVRVLEQRFGRAEYVLDFLIEKIKAGKKPDLSKPETIVEFGTAVEDLMTNIVNFDEDEYLMNKQLVNELVNKLPGSMKNSWFEYLCDDPVRSSNLRFFSRWIAKRVEVALRQVKPSVTSPVKSEERPLRNRKPGSINASDGEEKASAKGGQPCSACKTNGHGLDTCAMFKKKANKDKWQIVKENRHCFNCLKLNHRSTDCKKAGECGIDGCTMRHHRLLHLTVKPNDGGQPNAPRRHVQPAQREETDEEPVGDEENLGTIGLSVEIINGTDGPLPIVPLRVKAANGQMRVIHALLDSGASRTLITRRLAKDLGLKGKPIDYNYRTVSGAVERNHDAELVNFSVSGKFRNAKMWPITSAVTVNTIGIAPYSLDVEAAKEKWPYLRSYKGRSLIAVIPELVIGADHGFLMMHRQLLFSTINEPVGMRTVLGWILQGKITRTNATGTTCHVGGVITNELLHNLIKESFKLDDYVTREGQDRMPSVEDKCALSIMESTTRQREDGRWEIGHLWRNTESFPTDGYQEALSRLIKTERRMRKDSTFAEVYVKKIEEYKDKDYIRQLDIDEVAEANGKTRYVSHFGVVNPNKPGKFRLVFDAAEKAGGVSLNDCLLTGPDLIRPLQAILWNFRLHKIVICGDIEDMFHRVYIKEEDQTAQRFLWRNGDIHRQPDVYLMEVMIFGATSSPSCAIYIKNRNADLFNEVYPDAVLSLKDDTYCDDTLTGSSTEEEAIELRRQITEICNYGGFNMKKWISNSSVVMKSIPEDLRLEGKRKLAEGTSENERVLGLWWDPQADEFTFQVKFNKVNPDVLNGKVPTKREACSVVMSLYDPMGFIGNYKIKGMIILQQTWRSGIEWDDTMPEDVFQNWRVWLADLHRIEEIKIARCYSDNLDKAMDTQLHTFVDASAEALAAVCYVRIASIHGIEVVFVGSSVKVAPLKKKTIPRLELEAAVLGVKLAKKVLRDLKMKIDSGIYWSDSSTALSWIKSEAARFKEYVANRVGRIQEETNGHEWRWVPTKENVADDATRLATVADLSSDSRWLRGPAFLQQPPDEWPKKEVQEDMSTIAAVSGEAVASTRSEDGTVIPNVERFSSFHRLVRVTAAVKALGLHWLARIREKDPRRKQKLISSWNEDKFQTYIAAQVYMEAEKKVIRFAQTKLDLKKYRKLSPVLDQDGIVRPKGRIENASCIGENTRHPILLPTKHHVVDLIIDQAHRAFGHYGRNTVFNALREKYYIEDGRQAVRRCWSRCWFCKLKKASPIYPEMGNLPAFRLEANCQPFCYTGVDLFGPIEVTVGRRHEKRWGVIFTDLVVRGTHLDVVNGLSADEMLLALSRFVDSRGVPQHIYSDNATNFHAVAKETKKLEKYHNLEWHFIPAASPHMGGAWESLVKQTKKVLYNLLDQKYPKDQILMTVLKAVENIINSRPLSYVSGDVDDEPALTPNHFLRGIGVASKTGNGANSSSSFLGVEVGDELWGKQWERAQIMAKQFWARWTKEVLPDLLKRNKWTEKKEPVAVGDIVIMVDELKPRNAWVKAVVTRIFPGKDGVVRVVEVTTRDFKTKSSSNYRRAVAKICPTGLRCDLSTTKPEVPKSRGRKCCGVK